MKLRISSWLASVALAFTLSFLAMPGEVRAVELSFTGGTCEIIDAQATGIYIGSCQNLTEQTVNDIHLTFKLENLPNVTLDYIQCGFFETNCFGPPVAPGGTWQGIGGGEGALADPIIWGRGVILDKDVNINNIVMTGYWTKDGVPVIPEPESVALCLAGMAVLWGKGRGRRLRRQG